MMCSSELVYRECLASVSYAYAIANRQGLTTEINVIQI